MKLSATADIFQVGQIDFTRTTHLGVGAHQDDLEIMATNGVVECRNSGTRWFTGVVVTNGAGSVRTGEQEQLTRTEMIKLRKQEQIRAAEKGEYLGVVQLGFESKDVKTPQKALVDELSAVIDHCRPEVIYTHNPADKHGTHVGVFNHLLLALRQLDYQPKSFYGCEVWRALDWLPDDKKVALPITCDDQFVLDLVGCHASQAKDGKNFAQAALGRMKANAAFFESHNVNRSDKMWFAMDLLPLLEHPQLTVAEFVESFINNFKFEIDESLKTFAKEP